MAGFFGECGRACSNSQPRRRHTFFSFSSADRPWSDCCRPEGGCTNTVGSYTKSESGEWSAISGAQFLCISSRKQSMRRFLCWLLREDRFSLEGPSFIQRLGGGCPRD